MFENEINTGLLDIFILVVTNTMWYYNGKATGYQELADDILPLIGELKQ